MLICIDSHAIIWGIKKQAFKNTIRKLAVTSIILALFSIAIGIDFLAVSDFYDPDSPLFKDIVMAGMALILNFLIVSGALLSYSMWWNEDF